MSRNLNVEALTGRGEFYAFNWISPDVADPSTGKPRYGPAMVLRDLHHLSFKDEFEIVFEAMRGELGKNAWAKFEKAWKKKAEPREDKVFHELLKTKLAVTPDGQHMDGQIGSTVIGGRRIGTQIVEVEPRDSIMRRKRLGLPKEGNRELVHKIINLDWPIYAGEEQERANKSGVADPIPGRLGNAVKTFLGDESGALNTTVSNGSILLGVDALGDDLDEGTKGSVISGYTTAQPAGPDVAVSGQTKLFTCRTTGTVTFGAATDAGPGGIKTANAITDDTSADATNTLDWCRASSSNTDFVALDDMIDGSAGVGTFDWVFNTAAIVAGATVSITSWTITLPES